MSWLTAGLAAISGALEAWNHERGKAASKETIQLGLDIARAKDNKAAADAAKRVAEMMTEQMDDDDIDELARHLGRERDRRGRERLH